MSLASAIVALGFALISFAAGAHAVAPWRLRRSPPEARRPWALGAPLLLSLAALAFLSLLGRTEDAAIASGLAPFSVSRMSLALGTTGAGLCLADLLLLFAWRRLEDRGWPLLALFGIAATVAQAFALAALAGGDARAPSAALPLRAAALLALALGASEAILSRAPRLPAAASLAGLGLPLFAFALPEAVRAPFLSAGGLAFLGAAAALLFLTRFVASPARRGALALAGLLLAGLAWAKAVDVAGALAGQLPTIEGRELQ